MVRKYTLFDVLLLCCYKCAAWIAATLLCVSQAIFAPQCLRVTHKGRCYSSPLWTQADLQSTDKHLARAPHQHSTLRLTEAFLPRQKKCVKHFLALFQYCSWNEASIFQSKLFLLTCWEHGFPPGGNATGKWRARWGGTIFFFFKIAFSQCAVIHLFLSLKA